MSAPDSDRGSKIKVMTASELKEKIRNGTPPALEEVDVVTCGTFGIMSGTAAVFSFQMTEPGTFKKADSLKLNGIPAAVGPCPNESNGFVDAIVYGTAVSETLKNYGGGHLFKDLVSGKTIQAAVQSDGKLFEKEVTLQDFNTARMIVTRGAFQNYSAFVNGSEKPVQTIFSVTGLNGKFSEATVSGCGEINPLQNDPFLKHHAPGTPVLLNGARGIILGTGTRSTKEKPNLSMAADMFSMNPDLMGGFMTAAGPECLTSAATAIPVTDSETYSNLQITDDKILLPLSEIKDRQPIGFGTYANVWTGTDRRIRVHRDKCKNCGAGGNSDACENDICAAVLNCPVNAITESGGILKECVSCLTCTISCPNGVYTADGGILKLNGLTIPIHLRQSDRNRGEAACLLLKKEIELGRWY